VTSLESNDPGIIQQQIEQTRERVADTVESLAHKADLPARTKEAIGERLESVKGAVSTAQESVRTTLAGVKENAQTTLESTKERTRSTLASALDAADAARSKVVDALAEGRERMPAPDDAEAALGDLRSTIARNPLGLALGSIAAGLLTGLAIPLSQIEREQVGPFAGRAADAARAKVSDLITRTVDQFDSDSGTSPTV